MKKEFHYGLVLASDRLYLIHEFLENRKKPARDSFKYSKKNIDARKFLRRFDENLNFMANDVTTHGYQFQKRLERTCADELKKIFPPRGRRNTNHWKNDELSELRRATLRSRRRAQQTVAAGSDNSGLMANEFKEARRILKRAVGPRKDEKWREICATLEQDPWRRPYRIVKARMARNVPPEGLNKDGVARILDDLLVTN